VVLGIHVLFLTMRFQFSIYIYYRIILIIFSFLFFFFGLYLININQIFILEWNFLNMGGCDIIFPLILDKYGLLFSSVVLFISSNVLIFSNYYISEELFNKRFLYLVVLFILSINFLIFIPHLIGLLLGWDGLGLVSFVLVIYYQNKKIFRGWFNYGDKKSYWGCFFTFEYWMGFKSGSLDNSSNMG